MTGPDCEMAVWQPDDEPRRTSFGADLFAFGALMAVLLTLYGVFG